MSQYDLPSLMQSLAEQIRPALQNGYRIIGIHTGGVWLAQELSKILGHTEPCGTLDISFYRDDFSRIGLHPEVRPSHIPFEMENARIILVDDVLYTGRTVRAAMNALFDYGRPEAISLAVLVDRGGREVPICAQHVALTCELMANENILLERDPAGNLALTKRVTQ